MSKADRHWWLPAVSADIEPARTVDLLLEKLIIIVEREGAEEVLDALLQYARAPDSEEGA